MILFGLLKILEANVYVTLPIAVLGVLSLYYGIFDYFKKKSK